MTFPWLVGLVGTRTLFLYLVWHHSLRGAGTRIWGGPSVCLFSFTAGAGLLLRDEVLDFSTDWATGVHGAVNMFGGHRHMRCFPRVDRGGCLTRQLKSTGHLDFTTDWAM